MIVKIFKSTFLLLFLSLVFQGLFAQDIKTRLDNIAEKIRLLEQKINTRKSQNHNLIDWNEINSPEAGSINQSVTKASSANTDQTPLSENPAPTIQTFSSEDDWYSSDSFDIKENPLNHVSVSLSLVSPNDADTNKGSAISFGTGVDFAVEYSRFFKDNSYIGGGFSYKAFEADMLDGPLATTSRVSGSSSLFSFFGTLGQKWTLTHKLALLTQASAGFASSNYDLVITNISSKHTASKPVSDTSFYYSFLLGLDFQLSRNWHTALFYELDGRSEAGNLDYQNFHQFGVKTSFGF